MTAITGNDGNFVMTAGSGAGLLNRFRANFSNVISEVTAFAETSHRRNRTGLLGVEGSASGTAQLDVASSDPDATIKGGGFEQAIVMTVATLCTYGLNVCFSNTAFDVNKLGDTLLTFDFVAGETGTLDIAWDEAP